MPEKEPRFETKEHDEELEKVTSFKALKDLLQERGETDTADQVIYWQSGFEHIGADNLDFVSKGVERYFSPEMADKMKQLLNERAAELKKQGKEIREELNKVQGKGEKKELS